MNNSSEFTIHYRKTIREAFKQGTINKRGCVIVINDDNKVLGIVSDGDFRRAIWNKVSLEDPIELITNDKFIFFNEGKYTSNDIEKAFLSKYIMQIPILREGFLANVIFKDDFYENKLTVAKPLLQIPAVIMAGGKGTRLDPFTRILPKALIPIGDKPMIEIIMDEYAKFGINEFYISINHKRRMIKAYFDDSQSDYDIKYIVEDKPLGTAGPLKFLEGQIHIPFFVSNCDILIDADYSKIYEYHKYNGLDLTIVSSIQHHTIPYGICEIENGGDLKSITEKPQYSFLANTGMYVISPEVLRFLPVDEFCHMTHLIEMLKNLRKHIGVFPVSEGSWIDVGQWKQYGKAINDLFYDEKITRQDHALDKEPSYILR